MARTSILVPTAEAEEVASAAYPHLDQLDGKRIGFVSNEFWVCLDTIWKTLAELLPSRHQVARTTKFYVPMTEPAPEKTFGEVAAASDGVIVALSGGGAGGAWLIHDAIQLVNKKLPCVTLVHEDFVTMSRLVARSRGIPDLRFVVLPRNINAVSPVEIRQVILDKYNEIAGLLVKK